MNRLSGHSLTITIILIMAMVFTRHVIAQVEKDSTKTVEVQTTMKMRVTSNGKSTVFELNNSRAAKGLYNQLPLIIKVEDYSDNEKIFYPPEKLNTTDTLQANAVSGTLAYYAPWGNVVMFYDDFGSTNGLYVLGYAVSGGEYIKGITGTIQIEKVLNQ